MLLLEITVWDTSTTLTSVTHSHHRMLVALQPLRQCKIQMLISMKLETSDLRPPPPQQGVQEYDSFSFIFQELDWLRCCQSVLHSGKTAWPPNLPTGEDLRSLEWAWGENETYLCRNTTITEWFREAPGTDAFFGFWFLLLFCCVVMSSLLNSFPKNILVNRSSCL